MNLRFVETFVWVARLGSFRAAADRLNATQAAVSNRIASLEAEMAASCSSACPVACGCRRSGSGRCSRPRNCSRRRQVSRWRSAARSS
nr:LysR family transcriptional regulator [Aminobacter sp. SS-2016]